MKFNVGDYVIRTNDNWGDCKVGETYEVVEVFNYTSTILGLRLKDMSSKFDASNFILSPISGSPLIKALS